MPTNRKFIISLLILSAVVLGVYLGGVIGFSRGRVPGTVAFCAPVPQKKLSPQQPPAWVFARRLATTTAKIR